MIEYVIFSSIGAVAIFLLVGIRIVDQTQRAVRKRFGKYKDVLTPGLNWVIPIIDTLGHVDIRERVIDMQPQDMLTRDKVSLAIDAMVMWKIKGKHTIEILENTRKSVLDVDNIRKVMAQKASAQLREIISAKTFAEVLEKREEIAGKLKDDLDIDTERWGIDVTSVQIKDVTLPEGMKRAMAQKAEADIEKEARITKANAEKEAMKIMEGIGNIAKNNPALLELRRLQTISEIGAEQNTTTVIMLPTEITNLLRNAR